MAVVLFPKSLPSPSLSEVVSSERRRASDLSGGEFQTSVKQRDYLGTQQAEWNILTPYQTEKFDIWWRYNLLQGGLWFKSTWPAPQGWVGLVRRFMDVPKWTHLKNGHWKVSATFQVRGKGMDPDAEYTTLLSSVYPSVISESLDVVHALASVNLLSWLPDNLDIVHALVSGTLGQPLSAYNNWPVENLDVVHSLSAGVLTVVLKTYSLWPVENLDIAHSLSAGTLTVVLYTYSNGLVENIDVTHALTSGTLT